MVADLDQAAQAGMGSEDMSNTEFMIRVSHNYHKKRERFFRIMDALSKILSLVALSALAASGGIMAISLAIMSGAATIFSVVLDFTGMASKHESLARQYLKLIGDMVAEKLSVKNAEERRLEIEAEEPTTLRGLSQLCCDEIDAARGIPIEPERLTYRRRIKAQFGFGDMPVPE